MKTEWKKIARGDVVPWLAGVHVTLNRRGQIVFNRRTFERLDSPEAVHLLYDRVNNRIGLQPTRLAMKDAYPVAKANRHGARAVRAYALLAECGIDVPETLEFTDARIDVLDLRTARVSRRYLSRIDREKKPQAAI